MEPEDVIPDRTLPEVLRQRVEASGPPQAEWLADGVVTNAELEAAFLAAVQCAREAGIAFKAEHHGAGDYSISRMGATESELHEGADSLERCFEDNFDLMALVYARLYGPTEAEYRDAAEIYVECANDAGVEGATPEEIRDNLRSSPVPMAHCVEQQGEYLREITMRRADEAASAGG